MSWFQSGKGAKDGKKQAGCGSQGERTRELIARRGEVPLTEVKYGGLKCRRLFPQTSSLGLEVAGSLFVRLLDAKKKWAR